MPVGLNSIAPNQLENVLAISGGARDLEGWLRLNPAQSTSVADTRAQVEDSAVRVIAIDSRRRRSEGNRTLSRSASTSSHRFENHSEPAIKFTLICPALSSSTKVLVAPRSCDGRLPLAARAVGYAKERRHVWREAP
jgi:hypothetical protein